MYSSQILKLFCFTPYIVCITAELPQFVNVHRKEWHMYKNKRCYELYFNFLNTFMFIMKISQM
jgi:hypothetical protein